MAKRNQKRIEDANEQLLTHGNLDVIDDVFTTDYVVHAGGKDHTGHAFVRRFVKGLRAAIPDLRVVDVTILGNSKDTVTWQRTCRGTHQHKLKGIPASNKKVEWREMLVSRFEDGKIAEEWQVSDLAGQLMIKLK